MRGFFLLLLLFLIVGCSSQSPKKYDWLERGKQINQDQAENAWRKDQIREGREK